jgi:hypothetical protein
MATSGDFCVATDMGLTSAARTLFDAQEHPLLGKIKALEVV